MALQRYFLLFALMTILSIAALGFYINDGVLDSWNMYGLAYDTYQDNNQTVFKTMYRYQGFGGTVNFYYVPAGNNITLEQPNPPSLRRHSDTELLITFWLHRNNVFYLNEQVINTFNRIMAESSKGAASFRTPHSVIRLDCQYTSDLFYLSLTESR